MPRGPVSPQTLAGVCGIQPGDGLSAYSCSGSARFLPVINENGDKKPGLPFRLVKAHSLGISDLHLLKEGLWFFHQVVERFLQQSAIFRHCGTLFFGGA